jgi:alkylation response protein AidB-like acyl-CoA dehydrogenase
MDLTPNDDQIAFVAATADWLRDNCPLENARRRPASLWANCEAMGWTVMTVPEARGGLDVDHATEALVFAELGRFLAPVALLSSAVATRWCAATAKTALALPAADALRIFDGDAADSALGLWDAQVGTMPLTASDCAPALDLSTTLRKLDPATTPAFQPDPRAAMHLRLLAAAYALGTADAARDMAAGYALMREQFDRPIGWFQAIKHICADMAVRCAVARSQLYYAAAALEAADSPADPRAAFHVAAAKRLADDAAMGNGRANIQVHGGIGMTDEAAPHLCLKRAHLLARIAPVSSGDLLEDTAPNAHPPGEQND